MTDAAGNVTTYGYDTRGRKITASDPDLGASTYTYDVLDKFITYTNAASEVTTYSYDLLGRTIQRVEPGLTSTWGWDTAAKGISKLASASTNGGYTRAHTYDALGRPDQVRLTMGGNNYSITSIYDSASRFSSIAYPSGFAVTYGYNAIGYQSQLANSATSQVLWTANARDAELHLTQFTAGNGVVTNQVFDPMCGRHPVGKSFCVVTQGWSVAPMCPACLLGANTDGLHAIREISSRSKARARSALG